jgi:hypothetical protein
MNTAPARRRYRCRQVAERLGVGTRTVQVRAREIPGAAKVFGVWTFDPIKLDRWLAQLEAESCRVTSTEEELSGGDASKLPEPSIAAAYEQAIGLKPASASRRGRRRSSDPPTSG